MPEGLFSTPEEEAMIRRDIAAIGEIDPRLARDLGECLDALAGFHGNLRDALSTPIPPEAQPELTAIVTQLTEARTALDAVILGAEHTPDP